MAYVNSRSVSRLVKGGSGVALAAAFAAMWASEAGAVTATTTMTVTATVDNACTISTTNMAFGVINTTSLADVDSTATVTATCTNGLSYTIGADAGLGAGATVTNRKMTSGANTLNYAVYTDAGRTTNWNNIGAGSGLIASTGTGGAQVHTVYGRIDLPQATVPDGSYTDTLTVTISY